MNALDWISVDDQLPKFITKRMRCVLLVYIPELDIPVSFAQYDEQNGFQCGPQTGAVTHFMYIQEPLKQH